MMKRFKSSRIVHGLKRLREVVLRVTVSWSRIPSATTSTVGRPLVVYLARRAEGIEVFTRFVDSYRRFPESTDHDLLVIFKGFREHASKQDYYRALQGLRFLELEKSDSGYDVGSFRKACSELCYSHYLFLGSFCRIQCEGYLTKLLACLKSAPQAGVVGPSGSWESGVAGAFPNYHIRTSAFMVSREVIERIYWPRVFCKQHAYQFEHGRWGLTRQILAMGLEPYVVGSNGRWFSKGEWPHSGTFRTAGQTNLMIADKRTERYDVAGPRIREKLEAQAWGTRSHVAFPMQGHHDWTR